MKIAIPSLSSFVVPAVDDNSRVFLFVSKSVVHENFKMRVPRKISNENKISRQLTSSRFISTVSVAHSNVLLKILNLTVMEVN